MCVSISLTYVLKGTLISQYRCKFKLESRSLYDMR